MGFPTSDDKQSTETNFARQRGRLASALTHLHTQNPAIGVWMHLDPNQLHFKVTALPSTSLEQPKTSADR